MKVLTMANSTAEESYFDAKKKEEIKAFFEGANLEAGDLVQYNKDYPFNLLRREAENYRFDIYYCPPGTPEFDTHGKYTFRVEDRKYCVESGPMRELLTEEDFESLVPGDKIYKVIHGARGLRVVGRMPGSNVYIILSDGEHLEHLYIPNHITKADGNKGVRWFIGKYDSKVVGAILLEAIDKKRESIERIYIKEDDND